MPNELMEMSKQKVAAQSSAEQTRTHELYTPITDIYESREGIQASVKNGVLKLVLPKSKRAMPRKIAVQAE